MNKTKHKDQIDLDLKKVSYFILIIGFIFLCLTVNGMLSLALSDIDFDVATVITLLITSVITGFSFYYCLYIDIAKEALVNELILESELIGFMYQQFDEIDLTVFSQKYFESEDEVLNFILLKIPHWFVDCDVSIYTNLSKKDTYPK